MFYCCMIKYMCVLGACVDLFEDEYLYHKRWFIILDEYMTFSNVIWHLLDVVEIPWVGSGTFTGDEQGWN